MLPAYWHPDQRIQGQRGRFTFSVRPVYGSCTCKRKVSRLLLGVQLVCVLDKMAMGMAGVGAPVGAPSSRPTRQFVLCPPGANAIAPVVPPVVQQLAQQPCVAPAACKRSRAVRAQAAVATKQAAPLPWQAAMAEVKKRRDIKKIMIIGAGPIVIGQVGRL